MIHVDLYEGAYGKTLRLECRSRSDLVQLMNGLTSLALGMRTSWPLSADCIPLVESEPKLEILLVLAKDERKGANVEVFGRRVIWTCDKDDWEDNASRLTVLLRSNGGHQYFAEGRADGAMIEVTYLERGSGKIEEPSGCPKE